MKSRQSAGSGIASSQAANLRPAPPELRPISVAVIDSSQDIPRVMDPTLCRCFLVRGVLLEICRDTSITVCQP